MGQVLKEDNVSLILKTLLGSPKLMKISIKDRREVETDTFAAVLKGKLEKSLAGGDLYLQLKEAAAYALKYRMQAEWKDILHCCLYLKPDDRKTISMLKYDAVVLLKCPVCDGKGFTKAGDKKVCLSCDGKGKKRCTRCNGTCQWLLEHDCSIVACSVVSLRHPVAHHGPSGVNQFVVLLG